MSTVTRKPVAVNWGGKGTKGMTDVDVLDRHHADGYSYSTSALALG